MKTTWETERAPARKTTEVLTVSLLNSFLSGPPYTWWILTTWNIVRSSHQRCFVRNGAIRNFAKFTGKHLCQSLFFNKVASLRPATLLKKRLWDRCFSVNFAKFFRTLFYRTPPGDCFCISSLEFPVLHDRSSIMKTETET